MVTSAEMDTDLPPISDEELAELAMAAEPDPVIDDDAVPFAVLHGEFGDVLPAWYMPAPASAGGSRRRNAIVATVVIGSLLFVNALGLCVTYGRLEIPF
jgi:hypothetical protein